MNEINVQRQAFFGSDPLAGQNAIDYFLSAHGAKSLPILVTLDEAHGQPTPQVEIRLAKLVRGIGVAAVPYLIKVIKEGKWHCKLLASPCFAGLQGNTLAKQGLVEILESGAIDSQRLAIQSLGFLGAYSLAFDLVEFGKTRRWGPEPKVTFKDDYDYLEKFYYYVLQCLIRMTSGNADGEEIARCLRLASSFLGDCTEHLSGNRTYDWHIRFVLHHLTPRAADPLVEEWIDSDNHILVDSGLEALGRLKLNRTAARLITIIDDVKLVASSRIAAGIALSNFAHGRVAQALADRMHATAEFSPGLDWAFSTLYGFQVDWPDCSGLVDTTLSSSLEVAAQMRYSLALRQQDIGGCVLDSLDADDSFSRATGALAVARLFVEKSFGLLESRDKEAAEPLEHVMILAAQIHSGAYAKVEQLHIALQQLKSLSLMREVWKREVLYAFFVADGENSQRGVLWCEAAHTTAEEVKAEMGRLLASQKPAKFGRKKEDTAIMPFGSENLDTNHAVMLIHGIRTQAEWQQRVATAIEDNSEIKVIPTRYEFLDVVRFLVPFRAVRRRPVDRIAQLIRDEHKRTQKISVIAHSFGSFIVAELLRNYSDIVFHRVILCGSIVKDDFPWDMYSWRIAPGENLEWQVLNDCGMQDIWPVMAKSMTWGYGSSGRFGFGHNRVKDRYHNKSHGDFFSYAFVINYWLPYLIGGQIDPGEMDRAPNSWLVSILTVFKVKYLILLVPLVILVIALFA